MTCRIGHLLDRLRRHQGGAMIVEAVIMLPLLLWCFAGSWVFFDAYRVKSNNSRSVYTIGDVMSRETGYITPAYLESVKSLQDFLMAGRRTELRISVVRYDADRDSYGVVWSKASFDGLPELTDRALAGMRGRIPDMAHGNVTTLVESWVAYKPLFDVGLDPFIFEEKITTRPRFAGQLCFNADPHQAVMNAIC